jgi:hypothetical protein
VVKQALPRVKTSTPLIETLLRSQGSLDKGSKVENAFLDPSSGMRGVGVKNLIETLLRSQGSLDKGSKAKNSVLTSH